MTEDRPELEDSAGQPPSYKWWVVGMLWFICFFNYADRQAIAGVLPVLKEQYGFTNSEVSLISAAFMWIYAITAPMAGTVGDRFPRKLIIIGGLYAWSLITGFTALCTKVWQFVFVRGAEGLGETFYFPASMSLLSDYHSKTTRSRAMSLHQTSVYAGTIFGAWFAGVMAERFGWQSSFLVLGTGGILLGLVLARYIREPKRNQAEKVELGKQTSKAVEPIPMRVFLRSLLDNPTALALIVGFFGANSVAMIFLSWMPLFLKEKFGLTLGMAGFSGTFFIQTASMVGAVLGGLLADRWRQRMPGGRMAVQALGAFCGAPFIFLSGYTTSLSLVVPAMTAFGLCKGIYDANIWASLYDVIVPSRRSTAVGVMNMLGFFGGALGTVAVGFATDNGMTMSGAIASTAMIYLCVASLLFFAARFTAPRDVERVYRSSL